MANRRLTIPILSAFLIAGAAMAADAQDPAGVKHARDFWAAVAAADTDAMQKFYAEKVMLKAGSELLKKQWGVPGAGDRSKDLLVDQDDLIAGYQRMIAKIGKDKWTKLFADIGPEKLSITPAKAADWPFSGVLKGDLIVKVATGRGGDALWFVLRSSPRQAHWLVVAEVTDY